MSANNLPIQVTSFVGREGELATLRQLLPTTRLLTLTGAGGTGKTRLALRLAASLLDRFKDGVWFVDLAPLSEPALVPVAIASVLGVRAEAGQPLTATLQDWLCSKELLLLLDNCEHLIDACASFADGVLHTGRETCILATGREALGIAGELAWRVPSLDSPNPDDFGTDHQPSQTGQWQSAKRSSAVALHPYASVRLFVERAKFANPTFALTDANAPVVAQICYRLDGIPLAIELAAARVKAMRVEQIAERLDDRFRLLTGPRAALPRHQTLRSLFDWSYSLLSEPERVLLRRLSVLAGGWTVEAAEEITKDDPSATPAEGLGGGMKDEPIPPTAFHLHPSDVLDLLTRLVEKSLVVLDEQAAVPRYHMLETARQYAHEKLLEAGENEGLRDRHLAYFQGLAVRVEASLPTAQRGDALASLDADNDNLRAALEWACERDLEAARLLTGRLHEFWMSGNHLNEARAWYARVLGADESAETQGMACALLGAGILAALLLSLEDAHRMLERSAELFRALGNQTKLSESLAGLSFVKTHQGDSEGAYAIFEANEATIRRYGDPSVLEWALSWWGRALAISRGEYAAARLLHEESLAIGRQLQDSGAIAVAYSHLGYLASQQGDYALARQHIEEGLSWYRRDGARLSIAISLGMLADVAYLQGDYGEARRLNDEARALYRADGDQAHVAHIGVGLGHLSVRQGAFEQAEALFAESLEISRKGQFQLGVARCLAGFADLRLAQGHAGQAVRLLATEPVQAHSRKSHIPIDHVRYERTLALARAQLDDAAFDAAWAEGRCTAAEQAISEALREPARGKIQSAPTPGPDALTVREAEVLRWLAQGLSDREIACRLVISVRTVHGHLRNIYGKLHVSSRTAAIRAGLEPKWS